MSRHHDVAGCGRCGPTNKRCFASEHAAESFRLTAPYDPARGRLLRSYQCPMCGYWHVTSKP